jgi:hypothetical protein
MLKTYPGRSSAILIAAAFFAVLVTGCDGPTRGGAAGKVGDATAQTVSQEIAVPEAAPTYPPVPLPVGTSTPGPPPITPTVPEPTITPTHVRLEPAVLVTPNAIQTLSPGLQVSLHVEVAVKSDEPIESAIWSPDGLSIIYQTMGGKLYWAHRDNSNPVYIRDDGRPVLRFLANYLSLQSERLLLGHSFEGDTPSYSELLRFEPGKPPTVERVPDAYFLDGIHWWRHDRASGVMLPAYMDENSRYVGGEKLITVDGKGSIVEERNVPYMHSGQVRPGGEWLAYNTDQHSTLTPLLGSTPSTGYLLNLVDGRRFQFATLESGLGTWSPDGEWLIVGRPDGRYLMSADMQRWIKLPEELTISGQATWSADSKMIAFSWRRGGCDSPPSPGCNRYTSHLGLVDLRSGTFTDLTPSPEYQALGQTEVASWSPSGPELLLTTRVGGSDVSLLDPAYYIVTVK